MAITIEQMPDWAMLRRQKQVLVDLCAGQAVIAAGWWTSVEQERNKDGN